jgi:hypothetical protein
MADKTDQTKKKRLAQGWRKHIRRLKQAARKAGIPASQPSKLAAPK